MTVTRPEKKVTVVPTAHFNLGYVVVQPRHEVRPLDRGDPGGDRRLTHDAYRSRCNPCRRQDLNFRHKYMDDIPHEALLP